jgi:putative thiamine transport system ATP-binding protein
LRGDFRAFVICHARERGLPILLVTHDEADAIAVGGRVIRLG